MSYKVKIKAIEKVTHDVKRFIVEKPKNFKFTPGQATKVALDKKNWVNETRSFTFTSLNKDPNLEFTIKGYPLNKYPNHKGMTEELFKSKPGDKLIIGDPWGAISYKGKGIFIAGGAGITPFLAIFKKLTKDNDLHGNQLIYSNKTKKDVILESDLRKYFADEDLILTLTKEKREGYDHGRIDKDFIKKYIQNYNQHFYICGPWEMVEQLVSVLEKLGAKTDLIVFEE